MEMKATYQFCGDQVHQDSVPVLLFSGPLVCSAGVASGWKPLGETAKITKSEGNVVYEINGKPAIEFYRHYFGPNVSPTVDSPLAVFDEDGESFYLRAIFFHDAETGTVTFSGEVPEGATVRLASASREGVLEGTASSLAQALERLPEGFESAGRTRVLMRRAEGDTGNPGRRRTGCRALAG